MFVLIACCSSFTSQTCVGAAISGEALLSSCIHAGNMHVATECFCKFFACALVVHSEACHGL